jgi:hypothetical protein
MFALIPPIVLVLVWLALQGASSQPGFPIHRRFVLFFTLAAWGGWLALASELLSILHRIDLAGLISIWLLPLALLLGLPGLRRAIWRGTSELIAGVRLTNRWMWQEKLLLGGLAFEALLLLVIAWIAPPNTNDAMQYHLARVMHWLQNGSLAYYPSAIDRQLWQPPWAELVIMNLMGLAGSDRWANLVQWAAFIGIWAGVAGLAAELGAGRRGQMLAAWAAAMLPMGILQATASQNDLVAALWLAGVLQLVVHAHRHGADPTADGLAGLTWLEWTGLAMLISLGLLTKGTFAIFVLPPLGWLLISALRSVNVQRSGSVARTGWVKLGKVILIGVAAVLLFNGPHWARNGQTYGNPFGPRDAQTGLTNQPLGAAGLYSNLLRNMAQEAATPVGAVNQAIGNGVSWLHTLVGLKANADGFTHGTGEPGFVIQYSTNNEELAGYLLHFLLGIIVLFFLLFHRNRPVWSIFAGVLLAAYFSYSFLFRWQLWGNRLILPLYVIGAALIGTWLEGRKPFWQVVVVLSLAAGSLPALLTNTARPVLPIQNAPDASFSIFSTDRGALQFVNSPEQYNPWISLLVELKQRAPQCDEIGYWIGSGDPEYALWTLFSPTARERRLEYFDPTRLVEPAAYPLGRFSPCAIFSSRFDYNEDIPGFTLAASHTGSRLYLRK